MVPVLRATNLLPGQALIQLYTYILHMKRADQDRFKCYNMCLPFIIYSITWTLKTKTCNARLSRYMRTVFYQTQMSHGDMNIVGGKHVATGLS